MASPTEGWFPRPSPKGLVVADVYTLASPTPTLYVYPSALHPTPAATPGGTPPRTFRPYDPYPRLPWPKEQDSRRRDDEAALTVLGAL